ncbi:cation efflux family protein family [Sodiomyces alkalinus F11]|uniref:Zinc transporter n=1 Tax=Sodiomyces alkalinus (strain CBS 110278 / VKM F-3762 / F11) TaxID=1314773 RepID=A0A3N2Q286_SODAK|nr:cation efflux family protein family [Sodiomyces alkalinus F11]ROT40874.1 cation efflux family protein family [Sodiomyces alkalinus F11]
MADDGPPSADGGLDSPIPSPFNFKTQVISTTPIKSNIGQRRGHRYKHSSISAQHHIFKEPPPRPPPVLPASLPIPTLKEARERMTTEQWHSLYWSLCHVAVAAFLFFRSRGSLGIMALSHLVFFDAGSALICVAVDVLGNFEVWRRSSIRHPFGLERAEVIAGFAMSIFLLFGGFDLVSHGLKHWLDTKGGHEPHHDHSHQYVPSGELEWVACAGIFSTLVSAYWVKNHARIARIMRSSWLSILSHHFTNVFHVLTIFFSILLLLLPLLPGSPSHWDRALCAAIACAMFALGAQLGAAQASMLLMSYHGDVSPVLRDIEAEPNVSRIEEAQFWQVHYGLCVANLKICVARGCDEGIISKLRSKITSMIQNRLGEGYGRGSSLRWEVTIQTSVESN